MNLRAHAQLAARALQPQPAPQPQDPWLEHLLSLSREDRAALVHAAWVENFRADRHRGGAFERAYTEATA